MSFAHREFQISSSAHQGDADCRVR